MTGNNAIKEYISQKGYSLIFAEPVDTAAKAKTFEKASRKYRKNVRLKISKAQKEIKRFHHTNKAFIRSENKKYLSALMMTVNHIKYDFDQTDEKSKNYGIMEMYGEKYLSLYNEIIRNYGGVQRSVSLALLDRAYTDIAGSYLFDYLEGCIKAYRDNSKNDIKTKSLIQSSSNKGLYILDKGYKINYNRLKANFLYITKKTAQYVINFGEAFNSVTEKNFFNTFISLPSVSANRHEDMTYSQFKSVVIICAKNQSTKDKPMRKVPLFFLPTVRLGSEDVFAETVDVFNERDMADFNRSVLNRKKVNKLSVLSELAEPEVKKTVLINNKPAGFRRVISAGFTVAVPLFLTAILLTGSGLSVPLDAEPNRLERIDPLDDLLNSFFSLVQTMPKMQGNQLSENKPHSNQQNDSTSPENQPNEGEPMENPQGEETPNESQPNESQPNDSDSPENQQGESAPIENQQDENSNTNENNPNNNTQQQESLQTNIETDEADKPNAQQNNEANNEENNEESNVLNCSVNIVRTLTEDNAFMNNQGHTIPMIHRKDNTPIIAVDHMGKLKKNPKTGPEDWH